MIDNKITKIEIAKQLGITHSAVVQWQTAKKIPAEKCIQLEPILGISARELYLNPNLLFDNFKVSNNNIKRPIK